MAIINAEDIVKAGCVEAALEEKRREGARHLAETGSLPDWWECGVSLGSAQFGSRKGPPKKYADGDELFSKGYEYFEKCAQRGALPTQSGLILYLGFTGNSQYHNYARRNHEVRAAHDRLQTMLQHPLEVEIAKPGGQAGKMFLLKNIPEGFDTDAATDARLSFPFRDKQTTELTGEGGGPVLIDRGGDPEETYMKMLEGGRLAPEKEKDDEEKL